ncbi:MAG: phosphotransferase [Methylococcaceae bacterium]|nr:phosphotransferase [Methylococcaceae bacterium]
MKKRIPHSIYHNLVFLIAEVSSQISGLQRYISIPSAANAAAVTERSGYAYNLKIRIHNDSHNHIARHKENAIDCQVFNTCNALASHLERIAELCRDCIQHAYHLNNKDYLRADEYQLLLDRVAWGISLIDKVIVNNDTALALKIGEVEQQLKHASKKLIEKYTRALKAKKNTEYLISSLFVARSIEHMGDALLNISESLISSHLGQPLNRERYHSLNGFVEELKDNKQQQLVVETIAETRSGSAISGISQKGDEDNIVAIFKEGKKNKLNEERDSVASWHQIYPGIAPKILSYNKQGESAALLIEHLDGMTFEEILLKQPKEMQQQALRKLCKTLKSIWQATRRKKVISANYMTQLKHRLANVYGIHPQFKQGESRIGKLKLLSFEKLLKQAAQYEAKLAPCFSVYIHGDFNSDNIIYDPLEKKINFIDLHRSRYMDYVQDVSVFMVSNYRLQVLDAKLRIRVLELTLDFYDFVAAYAQKSGDKTFELRLALGLARSFITSTRFILDKSLANAMFLRSRYLIEQVLNLDKQQRSTYRVPIEEIFVG